MKRSEREKLDVLHRLSRSEITRSEASQILGVSTRHVYRLFRRWQSDGDRAVLHRSRGGHSGRGYPLTVRNKAILLYRSRYGDYGPQLFSEALSEQHGLPIHRETLRRWLMDVGLWNRQEHGRRHTKHRRARARKAAIGMMLQLDGSTHDWFEGRNPELKNVTLLVLIDDASNQTSLRFSPTEDAQGVFLLMQDHMRQYGIPQSLYMDHGTVYWTDEGTTQFQRAMKALGIALIYAGSPQAKGRVERANRTFQDRLVKALRQRGIATIEAANRFLQEEYLALHNNRFARTKGLEDLHRPLDGRPLERILAFEDERILRNDYTVTVATVRWQVEPPARYEPYLMPVPGARIVIRIYLDGSVHLFCSEQELRATRVTEQEARQQGMHRIGGNIGDQWNQQKCDEKKVEGGNIGGMKIFVASISLACQGNACIQVNTAKLQPRRTDTCSWKLMTF